MLASPLLIPNDPGVTNTTNSMESPGEAGPRGTESQACISPIEIGLGVGGTAVGVAVGIGSIGVGVNVAVGVGVGVGAGVGDGPRVISIAVVNDP